MTLINAGTFHNHHLLLRFNMITPTALRTSAITAIIITTIVTVMVHMAKVLVRMFKMRGTFIFLEVEVTTKAQAELRRTYEN